MNDVNAEHAEDDLLAPSLEGVRHLALEKNGRPWRLDSQFYVGFFGGPLAVAAIAWVNAGRLRMDRRARASVIAIGVTGFCGVAAAAVTVAAGPTALRFGPRVGGVLVAIALYSLQRAADRRYSFRRSAEYDSLWGPGVAAVVGLGLVEILVIVVIQRVAS
jgi:hypothetical protein